MILLAMYLLPFLSSAAVIVVIVLVVDALTLFILKWKTENKFDDTWTQFSKYRTYHFEAIQLCEQQQWQQANGTTCIGLRMGYN